MDESPADDTEILHRRVIIGTLVISTLGVSFGMGIIMGGSFTAWKADPVLGIYNQSGWNLYGLIPGDGKLTFAIGIVGLLAFVLGATLRKKVFYAVALGCSIAVLAMFAFELVFLYTRPGVVTAGGGVYILLGGGVVGVLCSVGGYYMVRVEQEETVTDG